MAAWVPVLRRRLLHAGLSLLLLSVIVFFSVQVLPGNAATALLADAATADQLARITRRLGLDQPIPIQYLRWLQGVLTGQFGISTTLNQSVSEIILPRLANSAALAALTLLAALLVSLPLGVFAALRSGRSSDLAILTFSYVGVSIPDFVLGPLLILAFAAPPLALFPATGSVALAVSPLAWLWHLVLPVGTLTLTLMAHLVRQTRSGMLGVLGAEFIRAARLRGLPEHQVVIRHALATGLSAAIAVLSIDLGYLMGSIIIVEEVFAYPGLGRTMIYAIANRDLPLVQAAALIIGATYVVATLGGDAVNAWLNPRLRSV
jgi:peptide/nickel transport system permease protein